MAAEKTVCAIDRDDFAAAATELTCAIAGTPMLALPKEFSTRSFGWTVNARVMVEVGGKRVPCQVGLNVIVVGSKEAR